MDSTKYSFRVDLPIDFETAVVKTTAALQSEGFGIMTQIDMQDTLKKKLDVEFRRYHILGACNPPLAHQALLADEDIGLLLPANVIVAELDRGTTRVAAINHLLEAETAGGSQRLRTISGEITAKLQRVIKAVEDRVAQSR